MGVEVRINTVSIKGGSYLTTIVDVKSYYFSLPRSKVWIPFQFFIYLHDTKVFSNDKVRTNTTIVDRTVLYNVIDRKDRKVSNVFKLPSMT